MKAVKAAQCPLNLAFGPVIEHSAFKAAIARGAAAIWLPALEADVALEIEQKHLSSGRRQTVRSLMARRSIQSGDCVAAWSDGGLAALSRRSIELRPQ